MFHHNHTIVTLLYVRVFVCVHSHYTKGSCTITAIMTIVIR